MRIPDTLLIAPCTFETGLAAAGLAAAGLSAAGLSAARVGQAIARGVRAAGMPEPDVCAIEELASGTSLAAALDALAFDARMRGARAVVVAAWRLDRDTLRASATFEIATRARQAGVPAYAVAGENRLDAFDARILDLQVILTARDARGLSAAGRKLAQLA